MDSTNRTIVSDVTPQRPETSLLVIVQRMLEPVRSTASRLWTRIAQNNSSSHLRRGSTVAPQSQGNPWYIAVFVLAVFLLTWHLSTLRPTFDARGLTEDQLQMMEFNGDIV